MPSCCTQQSAWTSLRLELTPRLHPSYHPAASLRLSTALSCPADFACGVVAADGRHVLLDRGSLPDAVTASAAIPVVFHPVPIPGRPEGPFIDGGIKCRIGLDLWRQHRYGADASAAAPAVVHLIGRSSPFSGNDSTAGLGA